MKNKQRNILLILLLLIMCIGIGYATIRSNLKINGTSTIINNNFAIKFENIVENTGSVTAKNKATIGNDEMSVSFDTVLSQPGDYYSFTVDVTNYGTLNAEIENFEKSALTESQQKYLIFDIKYLDGTTIKQGDFLGKKSSQTIEVTLKYMDEPIEYPAKSEQTISMSFYVNYVECTKLAQYSGKKVSILGDSISTLKGYIPSTNRPRYVQTEVEAIDGLLYMPYEETWWGQVIIENDMTLGINESWAGSTVSNVSTTNSGDLGPDAAMANMTRLNKLDDNGTPDLILFYGGTNDIAHSRTIGTIDPNASYMTTIDTTTTVHSTFTQAYILAILRMQYLYPNAEIVSLLPTYTTSHYTDDKLATYNQAIIDICEYLDIKYIDLRESGITTLNLADGIHPNAVGMDIISSYVTQQLNNTTNDIITSERVSANTHAQSLPANLTSTTNLYKALNVEVGYFNQNEFLNKVDGYDVVSITIPVKPGDKIKSNSFNSPNPLASTQLGIRVTYLNDNTIVKSLTANETNAEYSSKGYLTVPEGVNTVCIPWWYADEGNWANLIIE